MKKVIEHKEIDRYLRLNSWTWGAVLYHELVVYFENKGSRFNLLDYSSLTLRDVCEKVWFIWGETLKTDNFIMELDSAIANFR